MRHLLLLVLIGCGEPPVIVDTPPVPASQPTPELAKPAIGLPTPGSEAQAISLPEKDGESIFMPLNGLGVRITAHSPAPDTPCWTFLSEGLFSDQVAITVRRDRPVELSPLLHYFQSIHDQGLSGAPHLFEAAGMAPDGPGFLGAKHFFAVFFIEPTPIEGIPGTQTALTGILLDQTETEWAFKTGPQRLLARLGYANDAYPTVTWADPERSAVIDPAVEGNSPLADLPATYLPSLAVTQIGPQRLELAVLPKHARDLMKSGQLNEVETIRVFAGRSPSVDGIYVHRPGQPPTAITASSSRNTLALNGLLFRQGTTDSVAYTEDLAELVLTRPTLEELWIALASGADSTMNINGTQVEIRRPGWPGWSDGAPLDAELEAEGPRILGVELKLSPEALNQRISEEDLKTAIGLLEVELINFASSHPAPAETLHIDVRYSPDGKVQFKPQWQRPPATNTWWKGLEASLETLDVPVVSDAVTFRMQIDLGADRAQRKMKVSP